MTRIEQTGDNNVISAISVGGGSATQSGTINAGTGAPQPRTEGGQRAEDPAGADDQARPDDAAAGADEGAAGGALPPYRAVLVVDAAGFSQLSSAHQAEIGAAIMPVLEAAFTRAGLADEWSGRRFRPRAHTGDGYIVGLRPETLPRLLHPFLRDLQDELRERDARRLSGRPRLRLRASIHVGPLPDQGRWTDGLGKPMTETHRLLDSAQARQALSDAHEEVTFLAAIVSRRVFEDVVEAGFTALHPSQFEEVLARSKSGFAECAYLHVPLPSRASPPSPR